MTVSCDGCPSPVRVLTVPEAAALLRCNERTLLSYIRRGEVPARLVGHGYRISSRALLEWVERVR